MKKETIIKILKKEKSNLEAAFSIRLLALFGSYSKNKQHPGSDIDIAFEIKKGQQFGYLKKIQLEKYLRSKLRNEVDLVRLKYMDPVIKLQIEQDMIYV
jgi:uncharacterized protein